MQIKSRTGNQLNVSELHFNDSFFDVHEAQIVANFPSLTSGSNYNGWRVDVDLKFDYRLDLEWLHQNKYALTNSITAVMGSGISLLDFSDVSVLKRIATSVKESNTTGLDFTNPLVLKAFETFLTVARLHSEVKHG